MSFVVKSTIINEEVFKLFLSLGIVKKKVSFPSIVFFDNEIIKLSRKNWKKPAALLHTFAAGGKSMSQVATQ